LFTAYFVIVLQQGRAVDLGVLVKGLGPESALRADSGPRL
jgi:hypothetical protein